MTGLPEHVHLDLLWVYPPGVANVRVTSVIFPTEPADKDPMFGETNFRHRVLGSLICAYNDGGTLKMDRSANTFRYEEEFGDERYITEGRWCRDAECHDEHDPNSELWCTLD